MFTKISTLKRTFVSSMSRKSKAIFVVFILFGAVTMFAVPHLLDGEKDKNLTVQKQAELSAKQRAELSGNSFV